MYGYHLKIVICFKKLKEKENMFGYCILFFE